MSYDGSIGREAWYFLYEKIDSIFNDKNIPDGEKNKKFTEISISLSYGIMEQLKLDFLLSIDREQADCRLYKLLTTVFDNRNSNLDLFEGKFAEELQEDVIVEEEINVFNKYQQEESANIYLEGNKIKLLQYE